MSIPEQRQEFEGGRVVAFPGTTPPPAAAEGSEVIEAELVDDPAPAVAVNPLPQPAPLPWTVGPVRRPVLPVWLADAHQRGQAGRWVVGYLWHTAKYHGLRSPWYLVLAAAHAPRGAGVLTARVLRYITDAEARPLVASAVRRDALQDYLMVSRVRSRRVHLRLLALAMGLLALAGAVVALGYSPGWVQLLATVSAVLTLARVGRPADRPILGTAVVLAQAPRLTDDIVLTGLAACGVNRKHVRFTAPIQRDGPGWRAEVELPHSDLASEIVAKRPKLAGGMRRKLGCVWPEPLPEGHPGQLVIWVGDKDLAKSAQEPWPLLKHGQVDLFSPVPYATDQRGRWIVITFMFTSGVIGSIPRVGKTYALREMLLIAALDPRARIYAFDLKGTGDFSPLEPVAYAYAKGDEPDAIDYGRGAISALRQEMRRRTKVIAALPRDLCPEFKVTSALADNRSLGLEPIFVGIDECQVWFEHPIHGEDFEADITDLVKRGPAVGIMVYLATQRPDAKSIPKGISDNLAVRFCLKVRTWQANDMVLGTGANSAGHSAIMFDFEKDKGIGLLDLGATPLIARTVKLDGDTSDAIVTRARALREAAGTIAGYALGEQTEPTPAANLLDDLAVVYATAERLWSETACEHLAELRPGIYAGWGPRELSAALKPYGLRPVDTWGHLPDGTGANRKGLTREAVMAAVNHHHRGQLGPGS